MSPALDFLARSTSSLCSSAHRLASSLALHALDGGRVGAVQGLVQGPAHRGAPELQPDRFDRVGVARLGPLHQLREPALLQLAEVAPLADVRGELLLVLQQLVEDLLAAEVAEGLLDRGAPLLLGVGVPAFELARGGLGPTLRPPADGVEPLAQAAEEARGLGPGRGEVPADRQDPVAQGRGLQGRVLEPLRPVAEHALDRRRRRIPALVDHVAADGEDRQRRVDHRQVVQDRPQAHLAHVLEVVEGAGHGHELEVQRARAG